MLAAKVSMDEGGSVKPERTLHSVKEFISKVTSLNPISKVKRTVVSMAFASISNAAKGAGIFNKIECVVICNWFFYFLFFNFIVYSY